MKKMITSGQKEEGITMIGAAARKAGAEAIEELSNNGVLNAGNFQRGVLAQGDKIAAVVKAAVKNALAELAENVVGRLERLFTSKTIELVATDGQETLAEAADVFKAGIYGAVKRGACKATMKTLLAVYEIVKDGTFQQIFGGFGENLKRLCWTESQIVAFCRDYHGRLLLNNGYGTFFLFQENKDGLFVACVYTYDDGRPNVSVFPLEYDFFWYAGSQHRIVVPQL